MPLEDEFCDIVKKARLGHGWTIDDVSKQAGIPSQTLVLLERGSRSPSAPEVEALGETLHLKRKALAEIALENWCPAAQTGRIDADGSVITVMGDIGGYAVKGYLLVDRESREAFMVDTAYNAHEMLELLTAQRLTLKGIGLTHGHADHAGGLDQILARWPVPVYLGDGDFPLLPWKPPRERLILPRHDAVIKVGRLSVRCVATPGHTPGGFCYHVEQDKRPFCFVGDTLFAGSIGRSNPFSLFGTHIESVRTKVLTLSESTVLLPGHGPATTVCEERVHNPFG